MNISIFAPCTHLYLFPGAHYDGISQVTQIYYSVATAFGAMLTLPGMFAQFAPIAGNCHRIGQLLEVCDEVEQQQQRHERRQQRHRDQAMNDSAVVEGVMDSAHARLELKAVTVVIPSPVQTDAFVTLFENLSLVFERGKNVLIMGPRYQMYSGFLYNVKPTHAVNKSLTFPVVLVNRLFYG